MARERVREEKGRVKFRFVEFELDASDSTLQDSLRNLAAAIIKNSNGSTRTVVNKTPAGVLANTEVTAEEPQEEVEATDEETIAAPSSLSARVKRALPTPQILDIDLSAGPLALKQFSENAKLESTNDSVQKRYLGLTFWLKHNRKIQEVTMDHMHTCFRHLGWRTPKDAAQPLRDLKSKMQWLSKGTAAGAYTINHVGENEVADMLKT